MIIVTGAAGFIASVLLAQLNGQGLENLIIVDDFSKTEKCPNFTSKKYAQKIDRKDFLTWFAQPNNAATIDFVFHLGARTDTLEMQTAIFDELNLHYSQKIWQICAQHQIPLVYVSSAATYGNGEHGYADNETQIPLLQPLNPYGISKNDFDKWALQQTEKPPFWVGLKFFNVYGPNEYHKGRMASVVFHAFHQIQKEGQIKLFKSHHPNYRDGEQLRDFIYVKDIAAICLFLQKNQQSVQSGIYNAGSGKAHTFIDLAKAVFAALTLTPNIHFIDIPEHLRAQYQYFTCANMEKLRHQGYVAPFYELEEGVRDYVQNYLVSAKYL